MAETMVSGVILLVVAVHLVHAQSEGGCALLRKHIDRLGCSAPGADDSSKCQRKYYSLCKHGCTETEAEDGACSEYSGFEYACGKLQGRWQRRNCSLEEGGVAERRCRKLKGKLDAQGCVLGTAEATTAAAPEEIPEATIAAAPSIEDATTTGSGRCPPPIPGSWTRASDNKVLTLTGDQLRGHVMTISIDYQDFSCWKAQGNKYIFKEEGLADGPHDEFKAYFCWQLVKLSNQSYQLTQLTSPIRMAGSTNNVLILYEGDRRRGQPEPTVDEVCSLDPASQTSTTLSQSPSG